MTRIVCQDPRLTVKFAVLLTVVSLLGCNGHMENATALEQNDTSGNSISEDHDKSDSRSSVSEHENTTTKPLFLEMAEKTGLDFTHFNGMSGELYFIETVGGGAALLDYDRDGDLDVYITQGHMLGDTPTEKATFPPPSGQPLGDRLFRNDLLVQPNGTRELRFTDVTDQAGIVATGYGMGATVGDFNNDGWPDIYVTNFGSNQLWQNNQKGGFIDVTQTAGVDDPRWSTSATFVDFDGDGLLDLFVCCYEVWSLAIHRTCVNRFSGAADYCGPKSFEPERDRLFRNLGHGKFQDVTVQSGIATAAGAALGVVDADFNGDGYVDFYVANDGMPNHFWVNNGKGKFEERAVVSGCAFNMNGQAEASMGIDAADFDHDGDVDIFMTHLRGETNTLYENDGSGVFLDKSSATKLGQASTASTGFGTTWFDYDLDGKPDLFVANGEVRHIPKQVEAGDLYPMRQPNQLYHQTDHSRFQDVSGIAGPAFDESDVSRGVACGDLDNDGDSDLIVINNAGPVRLLLNQHCESDRRNHWIGIDPLKSGLDGQWRGVRAELIRHDGSIQWSRMRVTASYLSANDPRIVFGIGTNPDIKGIKLHFPDGQVHHMKNLKTGRYHAVDLPPSKMQ